LRICLKQSAHQSQLKGWAPIHDLSLTNG
jgi:hypothetical protein